MATTATPPPPSVSTKSKKTKKSAPPGPAKAARAQPARSSNLCSATTFAVLAIALGGYYIQYPSQLPRLSRAPHDPIYATPIATPIYGTPRPSPIRPRPTGTPGGTTKCDPHTLTHICIRPQAFVACGPAPSGDGTYELLYNQAISCPSGTYCNDDVWEGVKTIRCLTTPAEGRGLWNGPGDWHHVDPKPEDRGYVPGVTRKKCDAVKNVARCTKDNSGFQLCYRTVYGDFYSEPILCNPATSCEDTTVNGVTSAGCTSPYRAPVNWESPREEWSYTPSNDVCDISKSAARCVPGSNNIFQLCSANPTGDGSFLYGTHIQCAPGTVCTPDTVNGVGSVVCKLGPAVPVVPIGGGEWTTPAPPAPPVLPPVPVPVLRSTPCNALLSVARCDPTNIKGVQLCLATNGPQGFYTEPTNCGAGTVCRAITVNGVGSAICDFPSASP